MWFKSLVKCRVVEYAYCILTNNMDFFDARWSVKNALVVRNVLSYGLIGRVFIYIIFIFYFIYFFLSCLCGANNVFF